MTVSESMRAYFLKYGRASCGYIYLVGSKLHRRKQSRQEPPSHAKINPRRSFNFKKEKKKKRIIINRKSGKNVTIAITTS